jgi:uncharacterized protein (TIGR03435 family)
MKSHADAPPYGKGKPLTIASGALLAVTLFVSAPGISAHAQSGTGQTPPAQALAGQTPATQTPTPQWQIDAGGKAAFDVVSVKQNLTAPSQQTVSSNVPLGPMDAFTPTGGLLSATNYPLFVYMIFAYKLNADQMQSVQSQLPKWANTSRYDIQAKGPGNPTKDQMRLMMQALLADRFKLSLHYETKQVSVLALVLDKPGKFGPQLRLHADDVPCSSAPVSPGATNGNAPPVSITIEGGFPQICGVLTNVQSSAPGRVRIGARNMPLATFTGLLDNPALGVGRPVLDKTGIAGKVDFVIEFTPQFNGPLPPGADFQPDPNGPTFMEALKQQLGLKLESQTGPVESIFIDHIEQPTEN